MERVEYLLDEIQFDGENARRGIEVECIFDQNILSTVAVGEQLL